MIYPRIVTVGFVCAACAAGAVALAARGQSTARPGEPTQSRVWVENRQPNEAIPVVVQPPATPVRVQIDQTNANPNSIPVRASQQAWEYRSAQLPAAGDGALLNNPWGMQGWEAVGILQSSPSGATILFKRPR